MMGMNNTSPDEVARGGEGDVLMTRKHTRKDARHTAPDHRPMIPEFTHPGDALDTAVREARRRYDDANPNRHMKWR